jgi:TPR repeat protein
MRRALLSVVAALVSTLCFGQISSPEALYQHGLDALSGANTSRNDHDAIDSFRRSAELGYAPAQVALGYLLDTGTLMAGSQSQAIDWYKKAASQGDTLASWMLGRRYYLGGGVPQDINAARKWLEPAAGQGNPFAAYFLGRIMADTD